MSTATADRFVHSALLYRGDSEYLATTVSFVRAGVAAGEPVAVAVPAARIALLRGELGRTAAQIRMVDMATAGRNPGWILPGILREFADQYPDRPVRIVEEPIWHGRGVDEYSACVRHEALVNRSFAGQAVTVRCLYDAERLDRATLADVARTHPLVVERGATRADGRYAPDAVLAAYNTTLPAPANAEMCVVDAAALPRLRRVATEFGLRQGLSVDRTDDLVLTLTELATNSIEHAHCAATVLLGRAHDHVVCQVRDNGFISDPLAGRRPVPPAAGRGRGLLMVNHLADLVRVYTVPGRTITEVRFATDVVTDPTRAAWPAVDADADAPVRL
ncbi:MAG TPA: sensor histidine kinase [Pseudonocardiaceae bacterium]|jgi:anti-sigma regulatory factor (Ser/Thr protein kinase)